MLQNILLGLGLSNVLRPAGDGVAYSTLVILVVLAFWTGLFIGAITVAFAVSPSLRRFVKASLVRAHSEDDGARRRLERYRQD